MIWAEEAFEIGRKIHLNFGKDLFFFFFFFFLEITCFWAEKPFEFPILAEKSDSILVKTFFFFFGDHLFLAEKSASISDKPFESDSKPMKIRVKVAYSCLTLSKKPPPPFPNPGYAPALMASNGWVLRPFAILLSCTSLLALRPFVDIFRTYE